MIKKSRIGLTTTVPQEIIWAADCVPLDLNNIFIANLAQASSDIATAERDGFPASCCAWIKGLYAARKRIGIDTVIGVCEGDCSNTSVLMDIWRESGVKVIPFAYPASRQPAAVQSALTELASIFGVSLGDAELVKIHLDSVREIALQLDQLACLAEMPVSNLDLYLSQLELSDFNGDIDFTKNKLLSMLQSAQENLRQIQESGRKSQRLRLGVIGVPTILPDLWSVLEELGAGVVYQEVPRQFALLDSLGQNCVSAYTAYTYPYDYAGRLADIKTAVQERRLDGIIHYAQTFCHRQLLHSLFKRHLTVPVLLIEGDRPVPVDERLRLRIEAFLERIR